MSLNTGPLRAMPARSSREMLHSRGGRSSVQESATGCCKSNPYIRLANEARSKQMFVRLIFSHLAWQQFVALVFVAKAWDVGFHGEPMAMFAPEMFENSLDGMCLIFFPVVLFACRACLDIPRIMFWLLHLTVFIQAFAWVGIGQIIGYGRTMVIAAITTLASAIAAGVAAYAPAASIVRTMKSWKFCIFFLPVHYSLRAGVMLHLFGVPTAPRGVHLRVGAVCHVDGFFGWNRPEFDRPGVQHRDDLGHGNGPVGHVPDFAARIYFSNLQSGRAVQKRQASCVVLPQTVFEDGQFEEQRRRKRESMREPMLEKGKISKKNWLLFYSN